MNKNFFIRIQTRSEIMLFQIWIRIRPKCWTRVHTDPPIYFRGFWGIRKINEKVAKTLCLANDEYFTGQFVRFLNQKRRTKNIELVTAGWRTEMLYYRKE